MTLDGITRTFREAGIEDARHEALLLIECFAEVSPAWALAYRERDYDAPALLDAVQRRAERYPLQYLLGTWEFCGLRLRQRRFVPVLRALHGALLRDLSGDAPVCDRMLADQRREQAQRRRNRCHQTLCCVHVITSLCGVSYHIFLRLYGFSMFLYNVF